VSPEDLAKAEIPIAGDSFSRADGLKSVVRGVSYACRGWIESVHLERFIGSKLAQTPSLSHVDYESCVKKLCILEFEFIPSPNKYECRWGDLPTWARWIAMDSKYHWNWFEESPTLDKEKGKWSSTGLHGRIPPKFCPSFRGDFTQSLRLRS
jgi:hypothetical protein